MKVLKYYLCSRINTGSEEAPQWEELLSQVTLDWSEANEVIARAEAHLGTYSVEEDGRPEVTEKSVSQRLQALEKSLDDIPTMIATAIKNYIVGR